MSVQLQASSIFWGHEKLPPVQFGLNVSSSSFQGGLREERWRVKMPIRVGTEDLKLAHLEGWAVWARPPGSREKRGDLAFQPEALTTRRPSWPPRQLCESCCAEGTVKYPSAERAPSSPSTDLAHAPCPSNVTPKKAHVASAPQPGYMSLNAEADKWVCDQWHMFWTRSWHTFSVKGQAGALWGFAGHRESLLNLLILLWRLSPTLGRGENPSGSSAVRNRL